MLADVLRNQIQPQTNECRNYLPKHSAELNFPPSQSNYGPIGSGPGRGNRNNLIHHKQLNHHSSNVLPINNQYNHQYHAPPPAGYTLPVSHVVGLKTTFLSSNLSTVNTTSRTNQQCRS